MGRFLRGCVALFVPFISICLFFPRPSKAENPQLREWSEIMSADGIKLLEGIGSKIPDAIFDLIHNIDVTVYENSRFGLGLLVRRDVFNNTQIHNTWTVIDQFGVEGKIPIFSAMPNIGIPSFPLGLYVGNKLGISVLDIREVRPDGYGSLPSLQERKLTIENDPKYQDFLKNRDDPNLLQSLEDKKGQWVHAVNEFGDKVMSFIPFDGENSARYSRFWNFVLIPFRLPLNYESFLQLDKGEVLSYDATGSIEFGIGVGWELDTTQITGMLNAGISASTVLRGDYRVSVLKESDWEAKVKVSRSHGRGAGSNIGGDYKPGLLDNIIIINQVNKLFKVVPFQISASMDKEFTFDVAYQYDLRIPAARDAYEKAVLGKLKESDELAMRQDGHWRESLTETGVVRSFTREIVRDSRTVRNQMRLTFLFKQDTRGEVTDVQTTITLPDGTHHVYSSLTNNSREWSFLFNRYEKSQHNFTINVDLDRFSGKAGFLNAFPMTIEGRTDDSHTTQQQLIKYILEVENVIGSPYLFPRTPEIRNVKRYFDDLSDPFLLAEIFKDLGKSSIYYQVKVTPEQVQKFIDLPEDEMWGNLEKAFHVKEGSWSSWWSRFVYYFTRSPIIAIDLPLSLIQINLREGPDLIHAQRIKDQWKKIKDIRNAKERAEAMGYLFLDPLYGQELAYLVRTVLDQQNVSYYVNAYNQVFGKVVRMGETTLVYDDLAFKAVKEDDFDPRGPHIFDWATQPRIENLAIEAQESGKIQITFDMDETAEQIYFDVVPQDSSQLFNGNWGGTTGPFSARNHPLTAVLVVNQGEFRSGKNVLVLDPLEPSNQYSELVRALKRSSYSIFRAAASRNGQTWGETAESEFKM